MNKITFFRWLTLSSYFGLMMLIFSWHLWINPLEPQFISITLLMQLGPLMFPLRGILHGKPYTHAWAAYLALFYFVIGIWNASAETSRALGILISLLSFFFFIGCVFYARYKGQQTSIKNQINETT
ncbi:MAG: DUF2069 domain-containing protein [Gammaproteobacteria bacterium]|nr:DUF2069 domain-containing protein [Gammaproteobacteria bacterium]MDH5734693.1 DUF2069 domain-containing protein [Gammaproteobacteria bacterium]